VGYCQTVGSGTTDDEIASFERWLVVVADAAIIRSENVTALRAENIHYIVGARLGSLSTELLQISISNFQKKITAYPD
jgi:hypothetical protein